MTGRAGLDKVSQTVILSGKKHDVISTRSEELHVLKTTGDLVEYKISVSNRTVRVVEG